MKNIYFFCLLAWTSVSQALLRCLAACRLLASTSSSALALLAAAALEDGWQSKSLLRSISFRVACFLIALSLILADMMLWHILWSTGPYFRSSLLNICNAVCFRVSKVCFTVWMAVRVEMFMLPLLESMISDIRLNEDSTSGPWNTNNAAFTAMLRPGYFLVSKTAAHQLTESSPSLKVGRLCSTPYWKS